jgi:hypothetical protein
MYKALVGASTMEPVPSITFGSALAKYCESSLKTCGAKKFETRGWPTNYRGPIAIHAAQRPTVKALLEIDSPETIFAMYTALQELGLVPKCPKAATLEYFINGNEALPTGCIIAVGELVGCHRIQWDMQAKTPYISNPERTEFIEGNELLFGDFTPGRFAWEFTNMRMLPEPIPAKGKQGLWNWEREVA